MGVLGALDVLGVWYGKGLVESAIIAPLPTRPSFGALPPWEVAAGVVDYSLVPSDLSGPTPSILRVAQLYDYWPASVVQDFVVYVRDTYRKDIEVQATAFKSNADLYDSLRSGEGYDIVFPTSHMVGLLDSLGLVYNVNPDWIPNAANLDPDFRNIPVDAPYDRRSNGDLIALPYSWGTTGVAWRTDRIPLADVQAHGMDFLWMSSFTPSDSSYPTVDLEGHMAMLGEEREVIAWGFKKAGWDSQESQGHAPTGFDPPNGAQWTSNETNASHVAAADYWLERALPNLVGLGRGPSDFDTAGDATSLVSGARTLNQAWSGDIMNAKRPDQNVPLPVDFLIPVQGSPWWIDTILIPSSARNLWLAHQLANFIHNVTDPWPENQTLTASNLHSTPNKACYEYFLSHPYANGWNMAEDPILYPNVNAPDQWKLADLLRNVGANVLLQEYNPIWLDLNSV